MKLLNELKQQLKKWKKQYIRILRQPYAKSHSAPLLNTSYVLTCSNDFRNTLENIVKGLNKAGFSRKDYRVGELATEEQIDALPSPIVNTGEQVELLDNDKQEDDFSDVSVTELRTTMETQGEKPNQRVVDMIDEATNKTKQYDNDSISNDDTGFFNEHRCVF